MPLSPSKGGTPSSLPRSPYGATPGSSGGGVGHRRQIGASGLPPPPMVAPSMSSNSGQYSQSISKSLTIEEMRQLHQRALSDADAKRTELRLVLASRYRELVGSSEEVQKMRERAQELNELVHALPSLMENLSSSTKTTSKTKVGKAQELAGDSSADSGENQIEELRRQLSLLPRVIHRFLDNDDVHGAAVTLIQLFTSIAKQTQEFPLATALAPLGSFDKNKDRIGDNLDVQLQAKMKMVFLYTQTLPEKIVRLSRRILHDAASFDSTNTGTNNINPTMGARMSAAALSALDLLDVEDSAERDHGVHLLDMYFDAKAQLLQSLLNQLITPGQSQDDEKSTSNIKNDVDGANSSNSSNAQNAEEILSKIVLILQHDVVLHPYQIFCLRKFPVDQKGQVDSIMKSFPVVDADLVKSRSSNFLAAHLPLIRTKVKSILVSIAGTTASALGQIRQSLYDKTDGVECIERLNSNGCCTWEEAVQGMVDIRTVSTHVGGTSSTSDSTTSGAGDENGASAGTGVVHRRFSLWSVLFSNTFSSLVHSLLTTSFHSVHARVVSTLRTSLASAPPIGSILPHEAYRNTLRIATELDEALLKVSDDAHELLVHAEERVESERRLRLSLYVQTCEIMGRLVLELRRMLLRANKAKESDTFAEDATKELIVGRLCYLLKFRLSSLPTLLDPKSSPAVIQSSSGMITLLELQSAFELADDNDDGLITFEEAMEAVDSAFAGTQFHGAEMVRETLLLSSSSSSTKKTDSHHHHAASTPGSVTGSSAPVAPVNVTLEELALLTARGLRHESTGAKSALGTVQKSLDDIIESCFKEWARAALTQPVNSVTGNFQQFLTVASQTSESEWRRIYNPTEGSSPLMDIAAGTDDAKQNGGTTTLPPVIVDKVSPHIVGYLLDISSILNRTVFSSDSFVAVHSSEYAASLGLGATSLSAIPTMKETFRWSLLRQALILLVDVISEALKSSSSETKLLVDSSCASALAQLQTDLSFIKLCFFDGQYAACLTETRQKFEVSTPATVSFDLSKQVLDQNLADTDGRLDKVFSGNNTNFAAIQQRAHKCALNDSNLFLTALFKGDAAYKTSSSTSNGDNNTSSLSKSSSTVSVPLMHNPLSSSRRFGLLPIQSSKSITEVQLRGKLSKDKQENETMNKKDGSSASAKFSSGLGFFSSMLKTK